MDKKDIQRIREFLRSINIDSLQITYGEDGHQDDLYIKDSPDKQWELCTSLAEIEKAGLLEELKNILTIFHKYKGSDGLIGYWIKQGENSFNELKDKVEAAPAPTGKRVVAITDRERIKENLKDFKRALRRVINNSQNRGVKRVAEKAGLTQSWLSRMLGDESVPRISPLEKLSKALRITHLDLDDPDFHKKLSKEHFEKQRKKHKKKSKTRK